MSLIRNILYNGLLTDASHEIPYIKKILHNFVLHHKPKYILHCGSPENALQLAFFTKNNHDCEILHIKDWKPTYYHWLEVNGETPNPHKVFLNKIEENKLQDHLISFNGTTDTAYDILQYRNLRFNMMISDNSDNQIDYVPFLKLLDKNALHIRYIGDKKLSEIVNEPIFQENIEMPFTYGQGYFITGMDYLSLYEEQQITLNSSDTARSIDNHLNNDAEDYDNELIWNGTEFVSKQSLMDKDMTHNMKENEQQNMHLHQDSKTHNVQDNNGDKTQRQKEREQKRLARQQRRLERHSQELTQTERDSNTESTSQNHLEIYETRFKIEDDGSSVISAARQALRDRRLARRQKIIEERKKSVL